ncbi:hypothetical protein [Imhoffiella purpurea]|uniref:Uncharacterized protein n=1 Tax=Imhoffiella purpurea TaxID=1249627 RepID=W9V4R4_9GAMM|nr:hypothetical protein [Imhoffiella purpurea]EXJ14533.1 hypothetical protein D779_2674 [Imhoffiella purpurea]
MTEAFSTYTLWFVNDSGYAGEVCVYQQPDSQQNYETLAWMVTGANPSVQVEFTWSSEFDFLWVQYGPTRAQQVKPATSLGSLIDITYNDFGFTFGPIQTHAEAGRLVVSSDGTIPTHADAVAGIGMGGAGTFAGQLRPNARMPFTPSAALTCLITFGNSRVQVNDRLDPATLNPSGKIQYSGTNRIMTARLDDANTWRITPGPPQSSATTASTGGVKVPRTTLHYVAGRGLV